MWNTLEILENTRECMNERKNIANIASIARTKAAYTKQHKKVVCA